MDKESEEKTNIITDIKKLIDKLHRWDITPKMFLDECHKLLDSMVRNRN